MADSNSRRGAPRKRFYAPPSTISTHPGVSVAQSDDGTDTYAGTKADLIATGLLRDGMFPGDPGMSKTSAVFWPHGSESSDLGWRTPGLLRINMRAGGEVFTVNLMTSAEECARRKAVESAQQERWAIADTTTALQRACRHAEPEQIASAIFQGATPELMEYLCRILGRRAADAREPVAAVPETRRLHPHLRLAWQAPAG